MRPLIPVVLVALSVAACGPAEAPATNATATTATETPAAAQDAAPPAAPSPTSAADAWVGRWTGPEGLFLQVDAAGAGKYRLTLKDNLDSEAVYDAQATANGLNFTRKGETVAVRAGSGAETGFKWLDGKADCLILVEGKEGYCRD